MDKRAFFLFLGMLAAAFFAGRLSAPESVKTQKQAEKTEHQKHDEVKAKDQVKVIEETFRRDGTPKKRRTMIGTQIRAASSTETTRQEVVTETKIVESGKRFVLMPMAGVNLRELSAPVFGVNLSVKIVGPIFGGAWALSNGLFGVQAGFVF